MGSLDETLDAASDTVEVDLSGAVEFEYLQSSGWQRCSITKVLTRDEDGALKSKAGNLIVKWYFEIDEVLTPSDNPSDNAQVGAKCPIAYTNLNGQAAGRTKAILVAAGVEGTKLSPSKLVGKIVDVLFKQNGEYLNVDKVKASPEGGGSLSEL